MSFRTLPILTALLLTSTPALIAQAASPKSEIQSTYNKIARAFARKDIRAVTSFFTDDYVNTDSQGTARSAAELREFYGPQLSSVKITSTDISIQSFSTQGNQAEVVARQLSKGTILGNRKLVAVSTFRDTWIRTAAGWRIQQSLQLSVNNTLDGRTISN